MATSLTLENDSSLAQGYIKVNGTTAATLTTSGITGNLTGNVTGNVTGLLTAGGSLTLATAQTASGTAVDFTGIPSWVKRITVMFDGVSTNGSSSLLLQLGVGSTTYIASGYAGSGSLIAFNSVGTSRSTAGLLVRFNNSSSNLSGQIVVTKITGNTFSMTGNLGDSVNDQLYISGSSIQLGSTFTAIRITTANGTDTFDAGTINISYEG